MAQIDCGSMQGLLRGGRPELKRVPMTAAAMAIVPTAGHVHRESATTTAGPAIIQRTASVPLRPRPARGLEPQQVQHLFHRHPSADSPEVNPWHGSASFAGHHDSGRVRPFRSRSSLEGERERPVRSIPPDVANPRACGRAGRPAPATPAPRPDARSAPPGLRGAGRVSAPHLGQCWTTYSVIDSSPGGDG